MAKPKQIWIAVREWNADAIVAGFDKKATRRAARDMLKRERQDDDPPHTLADFNMERVPLLPPSN